MNIIDRGSGHPIVLVPGLQGRWEFHRATVDALSQARRVLTFSLGAKVDDRSAIEADTDQIESALDRSGVERATICGISYGGLPALRFAATRPHRAAALILVSTPGPHFHLRPRHVVYSRWPRVFGPLFALETPRRLTPELRAAFPNRGERWRFRLRQLRTAAFAPISFTAMGARARAIERDDRTADAARVSCPTLIVSGEEGLDWVVNTRGTWQYATLIEGARRATLAGTGHLGSMTKPGPFADIVNGFTPSARSSSHDSAA